MILQGMEPEEIKKDRNRYACSGPSRFVSYFLRI